MEQNSSVDLINVQKTVQKVLGNNFLPTFELSRATSHSGHGVIFGDYRTAQENYEVVAAKLFPGDRGVQRAKHELSMYKKISDLGFFTLRTLEVVESDCASVLLTIYEDDLHSGNSLALNESQGSVLGVNVASHVSLVASELAKLHVLGVTHGDPQIKNFSFKRLMPLSRKVPYVIDLEKATMHNHHDSKGARYLSKAVERDMSRLTFSLGAQNFGGPDDEVAQKHFDRTVIEPYATTLEDFSNGVAIDAESMAVRATSFFVQMRQQARKSHETKS